MISYSVDSTIFNPPVLSKNEEHLTEVKNAIINYRTAINKCHDLITRQNSISVYLFRGIKNNFDYDYEKKASAISGLPMDITKIKLEKILDMNFSRSEYHYGDKIESKKYFFDEWFGIKDVDISNCILSPSLKKLITHDLESKIIKIGMLNQYVYKSPDFHFLIMRNNDSTVTIESNIKKFTFLNLIQTNQMLKTQIQTKQIDNITIAHVKFKTVHDAYKDAENKFANYLIFGNDVNVGIKTIIDSAGPPDRIFAYLETLKDFCKYKRNYNTTYDDADILNIFGCICNHEKPSHLNNQKVKNDRMFDNGTGQNELFELHLKPDTFPPARGKSRTVRIYFKWDGKQKKVIIGWIGDHRSLP